MEEEIKYNYISLHEATRYCCYSQEYLSLRARQGKLKAVKFGRNWVTKEEWLKEYLRNIENYNGDLQNYRPTYVKFVSPPVNLPVVKGPALRVGFAFVLIFVLITAGVTFSKESFQSVFNQLDSFAKEVSETGDLVFKNLTQDSNGIQSQKAEVGGVFKKYSRWLIGRYVVANDFLEEKIGQGYKVIVKSFTTIHQFIGQTKENEIEETPKEIGLKEGTEMLEENIIGDVQKRFEDYRQELKITPEEKEAVVVLPLEKRREEETAEQVKKLKESFSDEVEIKPDETGLSGIIKPIFRKLTEQEYLYMMVPIKDN